MSLACDSTRRRAPDERPQQILEAALEIFGEFGLVGARLEDIARRAGIAKGTIYLYFPNKEALFREVVRQTVVDRLDRLSRAIEAAPDASAASQLDACMAQWWNYLRAEPYRTVYRLIVSELHRFPDLVEFYAAEVLTRANRLIGGVIARGVERREFRAVEPYAAARMLSAMFITHSLWMGPNQAFMPTLQALSPDQVFAQLRDFAFHALRPTPESNA
ncbi:TetR family transcriptional regulator [Gemmatimonadetes bacterium T265]|nr:TetR family transcriptional regulator [Gemmatimonadetes bacterium T265]